MCNEYVDTLVTMHAYNLFRVHVKDEEDRDCDSLHRALLYLRRK